MEYTFTTQALQPGAELDACRDDLWDLLEATNNDFVPPLSGREPITLGELRPAKRLYALPLEHLEFALKLHVIIARYGDKAVGFLSFQPAFAHESIAHLESCVLIDTVAVSPTWRRRGVASELYRALFATKEFQAHSDAVLHTWSTNTAHEELIRGLGFQELYRIADERAPGIDTVVFHRSQSAR